MSPLSFSWQIIPAAIITAIMAYGLHSCDVSRIDAKHQTELTNQKTALVKDCENDKKLTTSASITLQGNHDRNADVLDQRLQSISAAAIPACVSVTSPTSGSVAIGTQSADLHPAAGQTSISTAALYKITHDADNDADDLATCKAFMADVWAAKGQQ